MGAKQLQVLDVILASGPLRNDVVHFQHAERKLTAVAVAPALLLAEEDVLVLAVRHGRVDVGAPGDGGAGHNEPVAERVAHGLLHAHVDQFHRRM